MNFLKSLNRDMQDKQDVKTRDQINFCA